MFEDDGSIPPSLRRVADDPRWRRFNDAQVSKTNPADNTLAATAAEDAAPGRGAALTIDTDSPEIAPSATALAVVPVNPEPLTPGAQTDLYRRATESWDHLKQTRRDTWGHYIVIGKAMVAARDEILRKLDRDSPTGPAYQREFKAWLVNYGLDDMDKATRARLIKLIEALQQVNEMLSVWSDQERHQRNDPNTVYRALVKWRLAHGQPTRAKKPSGRKELLQEIERLRAHIAEIEAARERETEAIATEPVEPTDIVIEADRSAEIEIVGRSRKKMTPSTAWRVADDAELERYEQLENRVFQISCACENNRELELPTLTAEERDGVVAKLKASAIHLNGFIVRLETSPILRTREETLARRRRQRHHQAIARAPASRCEDADTDANTQSGGLENSDPGR